MSNKFKMIKKPEQLMEINPQGEMRLFGKKVDAPKEKVLKLFQKLQTSINSRSASTISELQLCNFVLAVQKEYLFNDLFTQMNLTCKTKENTPEKIKEAINKAMMTCVQQALKDRGK